MLDRRLGGMAVFETGDKRPICRAFSCKFAGRHLDTTTVMSAPRPGDGSPSAGRMGTRA